jgi:hypothetical protein
LRQSNKRCLARFKQIFWPRLFASLIVLSGLTIAVPVLADDFASDTTADSTNGNSEERARGQSGSSSKQVLTGADGDVFMEEVPAEKPQYTQRAQERLLPDLRTVNVPVDTNGHIVPLINKEAGAVLPFYSQFEEDVQPLSQFAPINPYMYPLPVYGYPNPYQTYSYPWGYNPYAPNWQYPGGAGFGNRRPWRPAPSQPGLSPINPWFTPAPAVGPHVMNRF